MKKIFKHFIMMTLVLLLAASGSFAANGISASTYKAGDVVEVTGKIAPGQDLYLTIAQQKMFAPKDTNGAFEITRLKKDGEKSGFTNDTAIPPLYYLITNVPEKFGKIDKKRFGGPSVLMKKGQGIYSTTMFYLKKKLEDVDEAARGMLGPIKTADQWNFLRYANETGYGINTITKEGSKRGKIDIFSRSVITDHQSSGNYWDKGTSVKLDKATGDFTVSFKSFRHTPPDTKFDVYVNSAKIGGQ